MITVMLVDDHPILRKGIIQLIELEDNMQVICEFNTGEQAILQALELNPDLILLDLNMKGLNGIEVVTALRQAGIASKIVMYTVSDNETDVIQAIKAGVDGYILKDSEPEELIEYINRVVRGEFVITEPLTAALAQALRPQTAQKNIMHDLTNRERQIWRYIALGNSNKVIAKKLDIAETTVKVHVKNLLKKIQLKSRIEAALYAVENGIFNGQ